MPKPKVAMGQTELPVPPAPRAIAEFDACDQELAYAETVGREAWERQRAEWHRLHDCNCGREHGHDVGCPKAKNRL